MTGEYFTEGRQMRREIQRKNSAIAAPSAVNAGHN
jgi:hypothetical protein